jgi:hypothetical protein
MPNLTWVKDFGLELIQCRFGYNLIVIDKVVDPIFDEEGFEDAPWGSIKLVHKSYAFSVRFTREELADERVKLADIGKVDYTKLEKLFFINWYGGHQFGIEASFKREPGDPIVRIPLYCFIDCLNKINNGDLDEEVTRIILNIARRGMRPIAMLRQAWSCKTSESNETEHIFISALTRLSFTTIKGN